MINEERFKNVVPGKYIGRVSLFEFGKVIAAMEVNASIKV